MYLFLLHKSAILSFNDSEIWIHFLVWFFHQKVHVDKRTSGPADTGPASYRTWSHLIFNECTVISVRLKTLKILKCKIFYNNPEMNYTVVKWGHTEGIEREKTSSQNSQGIALDFWIHFSHSNVRVEYNWRAIPAKCKYPHILI